jgi:membrane dipeptidase
MSTLHQDSIIIDGLNISKFEKPVFEDMRRGGITAANCTVSVWENFTKTVDNIGVMKKKIRDNGELLTLVRTTDDIFRAKQEGKTGIILGFQNAHAFEDNIGYIEAFADMGVRVVQLCYNTQNLVGTGCYERDGGLSDFGREVITEMNRVGIMVDLSHVGGNTSSEAIAFSKKPVCYSHCLPSGLKEHPRNKSDAQLKEIADAGGFVGVTMFAPFLKRGIEANIDDYIEAIEYVVNLIGEDAVGIGTDFTQDYAKEFFDMLTHDKGRYRQLTNFGKVINPEGIRTIGEFPNLTAAMERHGWKSRASARSWARTGCACSRTCGARKRTHEPNRAEPPQRFNTTRIRPCRRVARWRADDIAPAPEPRGVFPHGATTMQPQLPINVDPDTGVWTTDALPMLYVPRHFFTNNHVAVEEALGVEAYAQILYKAGYKSAYHWCDKEAKLHGLTGMAVFEHYLKRLSQRGWGLFSIIEADPASARAKIELRHSSFVLQQPEKKASSATCSRAGSPARWTGSTTRRRKARVRRARSRRKCSVRPSTTITASSKCRRSPTDALKPPSNTTTPAIRDIRTPEVASDALSPPVQTHAAEPADAAQPDRQHRARGGVCRAGRPATDRYIRYYEEKAKGGVGLAICGGSSPVSIDSPQGWWKSVNLSNDKIIDPLTRWPTRCTSTARRS